MTKIRCPARYNKNERSGRCAHCRLHRCPVFAELYHQRPAAVCLRTNSADTTAAAPAGAERCVRCSICRGYVLPADVVGVYGCRPYFVYGCMDLSDHAGADNTDGFQGGSCLSWGLVCLWRYCVCPVVFDRNRQPRRSGGVEWYPVSKYTSVDAVACGSVRLWRYGSNAVRLCTEFFKAQIDPDSRNQGAGTGFQIPDAGGYGLRTKGQLERCACDDC